MTEKPDVFMPLFIGDYLAGTSRLTTELHGAYMLLIMDYWMNGPLPDNDIQLAAITKMPPDAWSNARASLEHFFSIENGVWKHKRVEEELAKAYEKKRAAKDKAEKAAAARWAKAEEEKKKAAHSASSNAPSIPQAKHEECPSPSPSPSQVSPSERGGNADAPPPPEKPKAKRATRIPDDWALTDEHWAECQRLRPDLIPHIETVAGKFVDHWRGKSGKDATKLDWMATWRNWLRNEKTPRAQGPPGVTSTRDRTLEQDLYDKSWAR